MPKLHGMPYEIFSFPNSCRELTQNQVDMYILCKFKKYFPLIFFDFLLLHLYIWFLFPEFYFSRKRGSTEDSEHRSNSRKLSANRLFRGRSVHDYKYRCHKRLCPRDNKCGKWFIFFQCQKHVAITLKMKTADDLVGDANHRYVIPTV